MPGGGGGGSSCYSRCPPCSTLPPFLSPDILLAALQLVGEGELLHLVAVGGEVGSGGAERPAERRLKCGGGGSSEAAERTFGGRREE